MKMNINRRHWAVTLLELLVVVLIIGILATIATGVFQGQTQRAKIAATMDLIRSIEVAITRYEVDTGELPPSGSGDLPLIPLLPGSSGTRTDGSGYLTLALVHSLSGNSANPASSLWDGPYLNFQAGQLQGQVLADGSINNSPGRFDVLDSWGSPIRYIRSADYALGSGAFKGGTELFSTALPQSANPDLPAPNPYILRGETYYNPMTNQLISVGPNGLTLNSNDLGSRIQSYDGAELDDITNFGF
jgi:prepilin-type N-terminal cleavage/methylation domain-containing protein